MGLIALFMLPFLGGIAAMAVEGRRPGAERWAAIATMIGVLIVLAAMWAGGVDESGQWIARHQSDWAPAVGVSLTFALDGLSAALVALSAGLGIVAVVASWSGERRWSGLFHLCICWTVAATNGVFVAFDLLIFAFFWEAMLVPSFLLIAIWGYEDREAAAIKFLIFNAVGGLGLLAAVFALAAMADTVTFNAFELAEMEIGPRAEVWLLLGFALAFLVKLPTPPFHAWLPDAHTEAPTAGSILLAGLLLKAGAYGLFRFPPMLFPDATVALSGWGMALGAFGTIYAGLLACEQNDAKRLIAYTSIAHMSIVLMGVSGGVYFALLGAGVEMIAHAFSASALFFLMGSLQHRTGTRDLRALGGLQRRAPRFAAAFSIFFAAALAMPGTANFLGEALVITGMFQVNWIFAAIALISLVISVVYATRLLKGIMFGEPKSTAEIDDLNWRETIAIFTLGFGTLIFGLLPQILAGAIGPAVDAALAPFGK
ncbi:MAG: NADH-quinone oxidoreductase subunit M [Pseudomonadota bacterium]